MPRLNHYPSDLFIIMRINEGLIINAQVLCYKLLYKTSNNAALSGRLFCLLWKNGRWIQLDLQCPANLVDSLSKLDSLKLILPSLLIHLMISFEFLSFKLSWIFSLYKKAVDQLLSIIEYAGLLSFHRWRIVGLRIRRKLGPIFQDFLSWLLMTIARADYISNKKFSACRVSDTENAT